MQAESHRLTTLLAMKLTIKVTPEEVAAAQEEFSSANYLQSIKPRPTEQVFLYATYTIVYSEVRRNLRVWVQNIFSPFLSALLYFMVFGTILGARIGDINGVSYIQFLVPGFLVMPVINAGFGNGSFSTFHRVYFKTIQDYQMAPLSAHAFIIGSTISGILRALSISVLIYLASILFGGKVVLDNFPLAITVIILAAAIFTLVGVINGIYARSFEEINFVPVFVLQPLLYLSGIFFQITDTHWLFQLFSSINPLAYIVSLFRYTYLGPDFSEYHVLASLAFLVVVFAVVYFIAYRSIRSRINMS